MSETSTFVRSQAVHTERKPEVTPPRPKVETATVPVSAGGFRRLTVAADLVELSENAADLFFDLGARAMRERGWYCVMLSGGETPKLMYELLSTHAKRVVAARIDNPGGGASYLKVPFWSRVKIFWTNDPKPITSRRDTTSVLMNNLVRPLNYFGAKLKKNQHYFILAGNRADLDVEARRYARVLARELVVSGGRPDVVFAGAETDGQVFGLTPNAALGDERWVVAAHTARGPWLTMTPALLEKARAVVVMIAGRHKQIPLVNLLMERGAEVDMPIRIVRRNRDRVFLLVDRNALTWPTFRVTRRDGVTVSGDWREGSDPRGPVGIGIHGFMGAGSMANLVVSLYRRSLARDREVVDGSFIAMHRGAGGAKRVYGYLPGVRWWFQPDRELVRDFAAGVAACVEKLVEDEKAEFGAQTRLIYLVGHSSANQIIKYLYANIDEFPCVRDHVAAIVLTNPFSTRLPGLFHAGVRVIEGLMTEATPAVRRQLEGVRTALTKEQFRLRDAAFRTCAHAVFNLLTNPVVTALLQTQRGRWKEFVSGEFIVPAMEEAGLPLEFYPAVAEAYKRIPPDAFLREMHMLLRADPGVEERADERIAEYVDSGRLRVLVVADRGDPIVGFDTARALAAAMRADFVELRMRDHAHLLKSRALQYLGTHMTHMFHPDFVPVVEAFLRGTLTLGRERPDAWEIRNSG